MNSKELDNYIKLLIRAREQLLNTIINYKGVGTKVYANTVLQHLQDILQQIEQETGKYASTTIPAEYQSALDEVYDYFKKNNLLMLPPAAFAQIHTDAVYNIAREMQYQISDGIAQVGRQVSRYVNESKDEALRAAGLEATGEKIASGSTVGQMQKNLINKLQKQGFMTVQYGYGKKAYQVPIDVYASLVARSTTREAGNLARENQLTANGYDLVIMSTHYPTCNICAPLQGRIYSISGKDKRFPPLSRAFPTVYRNAHPNCRHSIHPYVESLKTDDEVQEDITRSSKPFEDSRPEDEKALYNKQQADNYQMRQDRYQFERYRQRLGDDVPKSFHQFRKIKNADGEVWRFMQLDYNRRNKLANHPELYLPNADKATAADEKFSRYLFNPDNKDGYAKGVAFSSRLGYNKENWKELQAEIIKRAPLYPSKFISETEYGKKYEQKIVLQGKNSTPANTVVGWYEKDGKTWMTSCYIKEV